MRYPAILLPLVFITGCVVYEVEDRIPGRHPVTVESVVAMSRARVNEWNILGDIRANGVLRSPTADDIVALKQAGASDAVVRAMIEAPVTTPQPATVVRRVYYDSRPAEGAVLFGLGAFAGWALGHHHHHHHGHYHHRRGWRW